MHSGLLEYPCRPPVSSQSFQVETARTYLIMWTLLGYSPLTWTWTGLWLTMIHRTWEKTTHIPKGPVFTSLARKRDPFFLTSSVLKNKIKSNIKILICLKHVNSASVNRNMRTQLNTMDLLEMSSFLQSKITSELIKITVPARLSRLRVVP